MRTRTARTFVTLAVVCLAAPLTGQTSRTALEPYRFTIAGAPVAEGELWLYYYGWGYVEHQRLGEVRDGETDLRPTADAVLAGADIPANVEAVLVALHVPGTGWYQVLDVGHRPGPTTPMAPLPKGQVPLGPGGLVDLAPPVRQRLRLLNPDGSPRAGQAMTVEIYLSRENHCGVHRTFEGTDTRFELTTDADGVAEVTAPLGPLWLALPFYSERGGPLGRRLTWQQGDRLPASTRHTIQRIWDPEPDRSFRVRVRRPDGSPAVSAELWVMDDANVCVPTWRRVGVADAEGNIAASFAPEHTELARVAGAEWWNYADLSQQQLAELYRDGQLTVVWSEKGNRP